MKGLASVLAQVSVLALAVCAIAGSAAAQEPAGEARGGNEDIIVTAQFRSTRVQDTPVAITALNAGLLEARSQTKLPDIAASAPNVTLQPSVSAYGNSAAIAIRGVGQFDNNFAYEPGVGVYIDDVYYPTVYGSQFDLLDLDRVEILRGPQGILAGKNSIGGAVRLFSRRPTGSGEGFVEATYGAYHRIDLRGAMDISLLEDVAALRISGVSKRRDGFVKRIDFGCRHPNSGIAPTRISADCVLGTQGAEDFYGLRAQLRLQPSSDLEINIIGDVTSDNGEPQGTRLVAAVDRFPGNPVLGGLPLFLESGKYESYVTYASSTRGFQLPDHNKYLGWGMSGQVEWRLSDTMQLVSITGYRSYDATSNIDLDGSSLPLVQQHFDIGYSSFTQELRLNGEIGDSFDYTVGGYYFRGDGYSKALLDFPLPANPFYRGIEYIKTDSLSGFVHGVFKITPDLNLSGGLRYTDESKDLTFERENLLPGSVYTQGPLNGLTRSYRGHRWDYRAALDYRFSSAVMVYASIATGFKGGGVNPRPFDPVQVVAFKPETLTAYEVGTKLDVLDRRVRLNLSAFWNKYDDIQLVLNTAFRGTVPASVPINAGRAEIKGFEGELTITPNDTLSIDAAVGYLDFNYSNLTDDAQASGIRYGMSGPFIFDWKASFGIQNRFDLGNGGSITPRVDYNYQAPFYGNAVNRPTNYADGRSLVNARITYRTPANNLEFAASVTNLLNEYYIANRYDNLYGVMGAVQGTVGRPREWAVSAKYKF